MTDALVTVFLCADVMLGRGVDQIRGLRAVLDGISQVFGAPDRPGT